MSQQEKVGQEGGGGGRHRPQHHEHRHGQSHEQRYSHQHPRYQQEDEEEVERVQRQVRSNMESVDGSVKTVNCLHKEQEAPKEATTSKDEDGATEDVQECEASSSDQCRETMHGADVDAGTSSSPASVEESSPTSTSTSSSSSRQSVVQEAEDLEELSPWRQEIPEFSSSHPPQPIQEFLVGGFRYVLDGVRDSWWRWNARRTLSTALHETDLYDHEDYSRTRTPPHDASSRYPYRSYRDDNARIKYDPHYTTMPGSSRMHAWRGRRDSHAPAVLIAMLLAVLAHRLLLTKQPTTDRDSPQVPETQEEEEELFQQADTLGNDGDDALFNEDMVTSTETAQPQLIPQTPQQMLFFWCTSLALSVAMYLREGCHAIVERLMSFPPLGILLGMVRRGTSLLITCARSMLSFSAGDAVSQLSSCATVSRGLTRGGAPHPKTPSKKKHLHGEGQSASSSSYWRRGTCSPSLPELEEVEERRQRVTNTTNSLDERCIDEGMVDSHLLEQKHLKSTAETLITHTDRHLVNGNSTTVLAAGKKNAVPQRLSPPVLVQEETHEKHFGGDSLPDEDGIEPSFTRDADYPTGWLVYDHHLGVITKERLDAYHKARRAQFSQSKDTKANNALANKAVEKAPRVVTDVEASSRGGTSSASSTATPTATTTTTAQAVVMKHRLGHATCSSSFQENGGTRNRRQSTDSSSTSAAQAAASQSPHVAPAFIRVG